LRPAQNRGLPAVRWHHLPMEPAPMQASSFGSGSKAWPKTPRSAHQLKPSSNGQCEVQTWWEVARIAPPPHRSAVGEGFLAMAPEVLCAGDGRARAPKGDVPWRWPRLAAISGGPSATWELDSLLSSIRATGRRCASSQCRMLRTACWRPAPATNAPTGGRDGGPSPRFRWGLLTLYGHGQIAIPPCTIGPGAPLGKAGGRMAPGAIPTPWGSRWPEVPLAGWTLARVSRSPAKGPPLAEARQRILPRSQPLEGREQVALEGRASGGSRPSPLGWRWRAACRGSGPRFHGMAMPLRSWRLQRFGALWQSWLGRSAPVWPPSSAIELNSG